MKKTRAAKAAILAAAALATAAALSSCNEKNAANPSNQSGETNSTDSKTSGDPNAANPNSANAGGPNANSTNSDAANPADPGETSETNETNADPGETSETNETNADSATADEPTAKIHELDFGEARIRPTEFLDMESPQMRNVHAWSGLLLVGFSRDGKIAWIEERERDGVGDTQTIFYVQDLVSDEILVRMADTGSGGADLSEKSAAESFAERNGGKIDAELSRHKILPVRAEFGKLPYGGVDAKVNVRDTGRLHMDYKRIIDYSCVAVDGRGRRKTVRERKDAVLEGAVVCGFVKSPFEERLALVIGEEALGFEGCDLLYSFAGCAIDKGW